MSRAVDRLRQMVQEYQQALFEPEPPDRAHAVARRMVRDAGLMGHSDENYWRLWAVCALLNKEAFCRYWKKRPMTRQQRRKRLRARANAVAGAMARRAE